MLSRDEVIRAFEGLKVWSRGSQRAPHKPLLVLYAPGQLSRGGPSAVAFREVAPKLTGLL
jgi:putative restriction endonuclease